MQLPLPVIVSATVDFAEPLAEELLKVLPKVSVVKIIHSK